MRSPPGPAASASGTPARPGLTRLADDQLAPLSPLAASGENVRLWLGTNPVSSDSPPVPVTTRPPLSATPSGVASRQDAVPGGRVNSSQKLSSWAAEPPISTTVQPGPVPSANEVVSDGGTAGTAGGAVLAAGVLPQPVTMAAAMSGPARVTAAGRRFRLMTTS